MSNELARHVVRCFFGAAINRGNGLVGMSLLAPGYVDHHGLLGITLGPDGFAEQLRTLRDGFPDAYYVLEDMVTDGDKAVVRVTFQGTHQGPFRGLAPTGRKVTVAGVHVFRIREARIVEHWAYENIFGLVADAPDAAAMPEAIARHAELAAIW